MPINLQTWLQTLNAIETHNLHSLYVLPKYSVNTKNWEISYVHTQNQEFSVQKQKQDSSFVRTHPLKYYLLKTQSKS